MSINKDRVPLREILNEIQSGTDYRVFYSAELVQNVTSSVNMTNATVDEILRKAMEGHNLTYRLENGTIVISASQLPPTRAGLRQLSGSVVNAKGEPIVGATLTVEGSSNYGTATDGSGRFSLNVPANALMLEVSFLGHERRTVAIDGQTQFRITLSESVQQIDGVVVTGYSNIRRSDYAGSAYTVYMDDIQLGGVASVDAMLQGVIPGLLVSFTSGQVGSTPSVRVRGTSTLLGNKEPLWVVDGVIQRDLLPSFTMEQSSTFSNNNEELRHLASNAISWLNPGDIETLTVLKDAAATAIYGSSAANGVIVITTRRAEAGQISVNYNNEFSLGLRPSYGMYDRMNSQEIMEFSWQNYKSGMSYPTQPLRIGFYGILEQLLNKEIDMAEYNRLYNEMEGMNTDWFKILFRNSFSHKHNLSISGGTDRIQTRASIAADLTNGEAKKNSSEKYSANISSTIRFNHGILVTASVLGSIRDVDGYAYSVNPFNYAYETSRVIPSRNEDGTYYYHTRFGNQSRAINGRNIYNYNVENELETTGSRNLDKTMGARLDIQVPIFSNLRYKGLFSYNAGSSSIKTWATEKSYYIAQFRGYDYNEFGANSPEQQSSPLPFGGLLRAEDYQANDYMWRNDLIYDNLFKGLHRTTFQGGFEMRSSSRTGNANTRYGYMRDRGETFAAVPLQHFQNGAIGGSRMDNVLIDRMRTEHKVVNRVANYVSGYFLGVYSYDRRYVVNASARVDASNRFGQDQNKKWAPTWSVAGKWRAAEESFTDGWDWLNFWDMTASYGYQGNAVEEVSPHLIVGQGSFDNYYKQYTLGNIRSMPYPYLGWEKTHTVNFSVEGSFLNNRIGFIAEYYNKQSDVLSSRDVPLENGNDRWYVPGARMRNKGYEFVFNVVPVRSGDWTWQLSVNASRTESRLTHNDRINTLDDFLDANSIVNGDPYSAIYSFKYIGPDAADGTPTFDLGKAPNGEDAYDWTRPLRLTEDPLDFLVRTGKLTPDFFGGFNTRLTYRNWTLNAQFSMRFGGSGRLPMLYDYTRNSGVPYPEVNVSRQLKDRWKQPGDASDIPSVPGVGRTSAYIPSTTNIFNPYRLYHFSDARIAKTDMVRCEQIAVSYDFDRNFLERTGVKRLNMRLSVTNPFFVAFDKAWKGVDPGTGSWPLRRMFVLSLNSSF